MASLEAILAGRQFSKAVEGVKSGLPRSLPDAFFDVTDPDISGHTFEYYETDGNREQAVIVSQDSPANRVNLQTVKSKSATMIRTFESIQISANKLRNLIDPDSTDAARDEKGAKFVNRQAEHFKKRIDNALQASVMSMALRFGCHYNAQGQMLTSSSGATVSVAPSIPAGQLTTLDILGTGAILSTTWATSSTDIMDNIFTIVDQMAQLGGWKITHAAHGKNVPKYVAANDVAKNYINNTPALSVQRYSGNNIIPNGFCGLKWINVGSDFYIDATNTVRKYIDDDDIVFFPDPSEDWWRLAYGSEVVPKGTMETGQSIDDLVNDSDEVFGPFGYARKNHNPYSLELYSGLNWLPMIVATKAVCRGHTTP